MKIITIHTSKLNFIEQTHADYLDISIENEVQENIESKTKQFVNHLK